MVDFEKKTQNGVIELRKELSSMSTDMRMFSLSMRSLYTDKAVGTSSETAVKFNKLRDDTRNDAMVYLNGVLPLSTKFVSAISEYFEFYEALDYEEWCKDISKIYEQTVGYRELCDTLLKIHEDLMVPLKRRKDEATVLVQQLTGLAEEFEKKRAELEGKSAKERGWALALGFVPGIGLIASPILSAVGEKHLAEAVAKEKQARIQEAAAITVSKSLIPALEAFIDGIRKAAGFFSIMEQELLKFEGKAEKSKSDPQYIYYKVMNLEARDMKSICQAFYAVLPDVKTDFRAIPSEGTDQNYVDKWLEKQKKTIQENCKASIAKMLLSAIKKAIEEEKK